MTVATKLQIAEAKAAERAQANSPTPKKAGKSRATTKKLERQQEVNATLKAMRPSATKVNRALDDYLKMSQKADDKRLIASVVLSEAKEQCATHKLNFKAWCTDNLRHSYETIRRLIPVGDAERAKEGAGKAMLDDMRAKNAERNIAHRAKKKAGSKSREYSERPKLSMREAFEALSADEQLSFVEWAAKKCGLEFAAPEEA